LFIFLKYHEKAITNYNLIFFGFYTNMNKKILIISGTFVAAAVLWWFAVYLFDTKFISHEEPVIIPTLTPPPGEVPVSDPKNISYVVEGAVFNMKDGKAEIKYAPGSASKNILRVFGEPVYGDLDGDGDSDAALILQNQPGGSGIFYYAVLAINADGKYRATNALVLGDRIAPQTVEIRDGRAVFNYAVRKAGEPMSAQPSEGKSLWIHFDKNTAEIGEWVRDFEGESAINLSEFEARVIAEKNCIKGGEALGAGIHNKNTQTWWFDANLNTVKEGCNPACVVDEKTKTAEINWRCTGLVEPQ
jgi:hypothetical protein